jgi:hypothetical protein
MKNVGLWVQLQKSKELDAEAQLLWIQDAPAADGAAPKATP